MKGVCFKTHVSHFRCDEKEAALLCAWFGPHTSGVQNHCHNCTAASDRSDDPDMPHKFKTPKMVNRLCRRNDEEGLAVISQQNVQNAFVLVEFGKHNDRGTFGPCPSKMLHAVLLGLFLCLCQVWFFQMGPKSKASKAINGLAKLCGKLLQHQSDRAHQICKRTAGGNAHGKTTLWHFAADGRSHAEHWWFAVAKRERLLQR